MELVGVARRSVRGRRRLRPGLCLAATAAVGLGAAGCSSPAPPMTPTAFVTSATQETLAQRTADVSLEGSVSAAGRTIPMTGSGQVDMTTDAMSMNASMTVTGHSLQIRELGVGGQMYMAMTIDGQDMSQLAGRQWVQLPFSLPSSSGSFGSGNPVDQLRLLQAKGSTVKDKGTATINGVHCHGYAVTPSRAAMIDGFNKLAASSSFSATQLQQMRADIDKASPPTITVWFDGNRLLRRMNMDMQLAMGQAGGTAGMTMDFSNYGTPVSISAPPSSQVMSYQQFTQAVGHTGTAPQTSSSAG